jgi:hypothetical protein
VFDEEILRGDTEERLLLETRDHWPIPNSVAPEPGERERASYAALRAKHPVWRSRKNACGVYNCYGLVFASRRTCIRDDEHVERILKGDGYRPIAEGEALPGDLALYAERSIGLLHVSIIMEQQPLGTSKVHFGLSKWNDCSGEDIHNLADHPWNGLDFNVSIRFMTER